MTSLDFSEFRESLFDLSHLADFFLIRNSLRIQLCLGNHEGVNTRNYCVSNKSRVIYGTEMILKNRVLPPVFTKYPSLFQFLNYALVMMLQPKV